MTEWPFWSPCPCLIVKLYTRSPYGTWTLGPSTFDWFWSHFDRVNLNLLIYLQNVLHMRNIKLKLVIQLLTTLNHFIRRVHSWISYLRFRMGTLHRYWTHSYSGIRNTDFLFNSFLTSRVFRYQVQDIFHHFPESTIYLSILNARSFPTLFKTSLYTLSEIQILMFELNIFTYFGKLNWDWFCLRYGLWAWFFV